MIYLFDSTEHDHREIRDLFQKKRLKGSSYLWGKVSFTSLNLQISYRHGILAVELKTTEKDSIFG